ncbi:MAG: response regulator [Candidatus Ancaeobacter aquaticus]|nr:response regulator [Candidatus Ancaeobacter aquaticus]
MSQANILIIEDEKDICEMIDYNLTKEGYRVFSAGNSAKAFRLLEKERIDLIILDIMLPDKDGFEICKLLKVDKKTSRVPIIMLSAKSQETDKVLGLELGADDYVTKPFSVRELSARIKAVLRRHAVSDSKGASNENAICLDPEKQKVTVHRKEIKLTRTEFKLLEYFMQKPGMVLSREKILDRVFGYDSPVYDRTVDVHIKSLRKKLGNAKSYIETVRGSGYRFKE